MFSILIPTYNYKVFPLVSELHSQCMAADINYEIIALDDASSLFHSENNEINALDNCRYEILPANIGRSSIRNLLAKKAKYDWLLFLDADVFPKSRDFISEYLCHICSVEKVINGGLLYQEQKPEKNRIFRWVYGSKREALSKMQRETNPYLSFLTLNFLIHKMVFDKVTFNETIPNLRHEDTLFSFDLMKANVKVEHIDNPVYHLGLDAFECAMRKENESLVALKYLLKHDLLSADYVRIARYYTTIKSLKMSPLFAAFHKLTKPLFTKNLSGENPSLFIFDLYRLGYLFTINDKNE
ncbi:MAG TPA: glycosyltransferase [Flavobacterium sp.]|nr:glycosyltransferase [Flavobacterium sp.]